LGITKLEDAIGLRAEIPACEIIGVFDDYTLRPLIYDDDNINFGGIPGIALTYKNFLQENLIPKKISFRITSVRAGKTIEELRAIYNSVFPGNIFNWYFLKDQINNQYQRDQTARNQIFFFSVLAIGIACLGLLGIITDSVVKKVKEIGIRKVLGARLHHIAQMLLSATVKQIIVATVISIPMAYLLTQQYLEKFTERITLQWWHYIIPVALLLVIMFATIASVLYKAAKTNPVESLRYE
jgi:putative ABC transport system permease protein